MGIIKESLDIDFVVENRPLTNEEEKQISAYIIAQKNKSESKDNNSRRISKTKQKV